MHQVRAFGRVPTGVVQLVTAYRQPFRCKVLRRLALAGVVRSLAVTRDGRLIVGSRLNHEVRVCTAAGDLFARWDVPEPLGMLNDLAVTGDATPHIVLTDGVRLVVASLDGQVVRHWMPHLLANERMTRLCVSEPNTVVALCRHMWECHGALMLFDGDTGRARMRWALHTGECPQSIAASAHYVAVVSRSCVSVFSARDGTEVLRDTVMLVPSCRMSRVRINLAMCVCVRGNEVLVYDHTAQTWIVYHISTEHLHRCHEVSGDSRAPTQDPHVVAGANGLVYLLVWSGCGYQLTVMD